jgi:transcription antitermination factor NusG
VQTELKELKIGDFVGFMKPEDLARSERITLTGTARWFCAIVKANRHKRAELDLGQLGFRSFYPRSRKWTSHARVKTAKEFPILGRYIFVEIDYPRQSFLTVDQVIYIDGLIKNQGTAIPFPSHWIEGLLMRYMAGEWDEIANGKIPVGARIRIVEGEFQDQLATVLSTKGRRVNFKLLGDTKEARLDQSSVRAA